MKPSASLFFASFFFFSFFSFVFTPLSISAQILAISGANGFCPNGTVTLTATDSFSNYQWSNGATTRSITVNVAGNYVVTALNPVTNAVDTARKTIIAASNPVPIFVGTPYICANRPTTIATETVYRRYLWSTGDTSISLTVSSPGTYSVLVIDANGCVGTGITMPITDGSTAALRLPDSVKICEGDSVVLNATSPNATLYYWSSDDTTPTLTVRESGRYSVLVSNSQCVSYDTTNVLVLPRPTVNLGGDTVICRYDTLLLKASVESPLYTYTWQDSSRAPTYRAGKAGLYSLKVAFGRCEASDTLLVDVFNAQDVFRKDTVVCESLYRIAPRWYNTTRYDWTTGEKDSVIYVSKSGVYQALAYNGKCFANLNYGVTFKKLNPVKLGQDTVMCTDLGQNSLFLKADSIQAVAYVWSDGSTNTTLTVRDSGWYWLRAFNECGGMSDSIHVDFKNCFNPFVPNAFSPNDDDRNDRLFVYPTLGVTKIRRFQIYDRWGSLVFQKNNFLPTESEQNGWNGTANGRVLPPSVYVYFLEFENSRGQVLTQKGDVTLLR
jgi:gliding motility-associated-like protein